MNAEESIRLNCPQCAVAFKALKSHAGKRIKCPKCGAVMKVPGAMVAEESQVDDWFDLEVSPNTTKTTPQSLEPRAQTKASATNDSPASRPRPRATAPKNSFGKDPASETPPNSGTLGQTGAIQEGRTPTPQNDSNWLDDLPPLESPAFPSASPGGGRSISKGTRGGFSPAELAALAAAGGDSLIPSTDFDDDDSLPEPAREVTETDSEFRAKCPTCESIHFCKPSMIGKKIRCGDCHAEFLVPQPKKVASKPKLEIKNAPTFKLASTDAARPSDTAPWQKSAAEYLRQAEDEVEDVEDPRKLVETPKIGEWLMGVFGIFSDPTVILNWILTSIIAASPLVILVLFPHPIVIIGSLAAALIAFLYSVISAFAILESVANGQSRIDQWPTFSPTSWLGSGAVACVAMVIAAVPGALFGGLLAGPSLIALATTMFSIFLLFPYLILSMLDNGSAMAPVSTSVTKSITRCRESWGGLYFSSMLLFSTTYLCVLFSGGLLPDAAAFVVNSFLMVGGLYAYFSMIGRLAFQIGQAINAPPSE